MTELRQAPDKPDPRFWDGEARKLMLIDYRTYSIYVAGATKFAAYSRGAKGLRLLGFREANKLGVNGRCLIIDAYGRLLINACQRVAKEFLKEGLVSA